MMDIKTLLWVRERIVDAVKRNDQAAKNARMFTTKDAAHTGAINALNGIRLEIDREIHRIEKGSAKFKTKTKVPVLKTGAPVMEVLREAVELLRKRDD